MSDSGHVEGIQRRQKIFLPDMLDEYVSEYNPVRFIDAFVDKLDLKKLGLKHSVPSKTGRPSYDPADLLKLYIYGYLNQIRSSRKLERECTRNLELVWLMKKLKPDFKTISDFRKDNVDSIKPVFKEFIFLCKSLNLFGLELVGIDGSKFKAVNSKDRNFNKKKLQSHLKEIDERIQRYLEELRENDDNDDDGEVQDEKAEKLNEKIEKLEEKRGEYMKIQNEMKQTGQKEVSLTDPESRLMKAGVGSRLDVCYNVESAVDSKNHLVCEYYVTNCSDDKNELSKVALGAKQNLGVQKLDATADRGFFYSKEINACVESGITPYVTEEKSQGNAKNTGIPAPEFHKSKFLYDKETDCYSCPAGQTLRFMCTEDKGRGRLMHVYGTRSACYGCQFFLTKCTLDRTGRKIRRGLYEELVEEMRRRIRDNPSKVELRKELCEHLFGTMKRAFNQGYLLLKGLRKVSGEIGLTMLAYNMRRAINLLGARALIASLE